MLRSPSDVSNEATTLLFAFVFLFAYLNCFIFSLFAGEFSLTVPRHAGS
jgi:hypothetical protein